MRSGKSGNTGRGAQRQDSNKPGAGRGTDAGKSQPRVGKSRVKTNKSAAGNSEKKGFGKGAGRKFGEKPFEKDFKKSGSDKPYGDKPYRTDKPEGEERKSGSKYSDYKSRGLKKDNDDKPFSRERKEGGSSEKKPFTRGGDKKYGDKPFNKDSKRSGDDRKRSDISYNDYKTKKSDSDSEKGSSRYSDEKPRGFKKNHDDKPFRKERSGEESAEKGYRKSEGRKYDDNKFKGNKTFESDEPRGKKNFDDSQKNENKGNLIRLNKFIADAGICSRREADVLIGTGVVKVNGKIVTELGYKVTPSDKVQYADETLSRDALRYVLLNKPKDYITTMEDPQNRKTVMELVQSACFERIYPVGRLDRQTTGLLLLTNDGDLTKRLLHPKYKVQKIYHVELDKALAHTDMVKIANGLELEDGPVHVDNIAYESSDNKKCVGVEIHVGKNRIVRRIFESLGYTVVKLDRVAFAGLTKKNLTRGKWRFLTEKELSMLQMNRFGY